MIDDVHRPALVSKNGIVYPTFLVDGRVAGLWSITRTKTSATLALKPFRPVARRLHAELSHEGERLLRFVEDDATTFAITGLGRT
ncbi:MAG: hypothetical protein JWP01_411 [Myxococcales bacterium]|nr:hypothetical protein [Myxococcales bacterium]